MKEYISKFRLALMGIAIIGVMIGHCKTDWPVSIASKAIGMLCYSVFTGGFLFLSGFGIYYSMSRTTSVRDFYARRLKRVLIPWACIATPYFLFMDVIYSGSWNNFLWHISTLSFWRSGNYSGMWYVSVILFLYFIYPLYHRIAIRDGKVRPYTLLLVFGFLLTIEYILFRKVPEYYDKVSVCANMGIFFIGSYVAAYQTTERKYYALNIGGVILMCLLADFVFKFGTHIFILYNLVCVCLWAWLFAFVQYFKIGNACIRVSEWFGRYTLELYMIHLFIYNIEKEILFPDVSNNILFPVAVVFAIAVCKPIHNTMEKFSYNSSLIF